MLTHWQLDNMADSDGGANNSSILYEILILSEWIEDYDSVISKNALNSSIKESAYNLSPWKLLRKSKLDNLRFLQTEYPWHLAVSRDGKVVAVLQETLLEIKTAKDEYSSVVGKAVLPSDQHPKLRKLSWSPDNSFLAVARDNGVVLVYNLFGCNIATVEPVDNNNPLEPVVSLCFLQPKSESSKWLNELLIIYHKGDVKSILLSPLDTYESEENIKFSLENYYPCGISSVAYDSHHLLLVAGPPGSSEHGITVWRILNDYPYLKIALESEKSSGPSRSIFRFLPGFMNLNNPKTIFKMRISPNGKFLACLHCSGDISLWRIPGLVLDKKWTLEDQPRHEMCNPQSTDIVKNEQCFYPVDVCWWSDTALVIARQNGALSVCSCSTLENLLGDSPEFLANSPQISSIEGPRPGVIALECETTCNNKNKLEHFESSSDVNGETSVLQASIQAAIYSFTDIDRFEPKRKAPKVTQRIYRMIALKRTTPEELYTRKIDNEEYDEALFLAKKYSLDCDLVYQKRWRNSQVSKESIDNYLDKVNKIRWVVNECIERVPEVLEDAKELLKFGLKKTEFKKESFGKLSVEEKQLVGYRRQLIKFLDNLTIYEKIIGSPKKYNSNEYDSFRKKSAIVATVNFARQENWTAVSIMFTYVGNEVLPHWLPVLSNFPETMRPLLYRSLLPEIAGNDVIPWEVKKLRDLDWSEDKSFEFILHDRKGVEDDFLYKNNAYLREFQGYPLTVETVQKWYKKRIYELENKTGLVEHALCFVALAKERGIKNLNKLHNDLRTLESLVYLVRDENLTLTKLEKLNHLDQCKSLLSKTSKSSFIDDLKNLLVPFANRCKEENCHTAYNLLRDLLLYFSEDTLELPLEFLNYLKEGFMNPLMLTLHETATIALDCIYSCPKDDQLELCFLILECLPQRSSSASREEIQLHDRIDELEIHLEICEILARYETPKSVRYINENDDNSKVGKQLMENMAEYTRRESLDFSELLSDLEIIQSKIFTSIPMLFCYELCALTQMSCDCKEIIQSAEDLLECRRGEKDKLVPYERSIELVLQAARNHFERATNFDDHCIQLSQACLRLIGEPHPEICKELDLIEAIQLLGDFDVSMLPLQVRKYDHKMKLIEFCLKAKPKNYKSCQKLLQLAQSLRIYDDNRIKREGEVLMLIAEYALNYSDHKYCSEICNRLITRNFSPAWTIVRLLAQALDYNLVDSKKLYFAFSILNCPVENLEELIESRVELHQKHF